ncbi:MAG: hypothetical protein A2309_02850 [Bacteroidetes bacterium RIFOXYB2_FULL_35_7]|nr:MAG: hypothetical protein A2309_02850 [Bacteroidetes bacterium RIFOXYB2_FULL_35_7]
MKALLNNIILEKHAQMIGAMSGLYSLTHSMEMDMIVHPIEEAGYKSFSNYVCSEVIKQNNKKTRHRKKMLAALYEIYEHMKIFRSADIAREEVINKISEIAIELIDFAEKSEKQ